MKNGCKTVKSKKRIALGLERVFNPIVIKFSSEFDYFSEFLI